jgi:hypothetical protein
MFSPDSSTLRSRGRRGGSFTSFTSADGSPYERAYASASPIGCDCCFRRQRRNRTRYIRKTPKVVSGIGAFNAAEIPSASTRRVSSGSMIPSSHSRAVE